MQIGAMNRVVILGASRGLGAALVKHIGTLFESEGHEVMGFARKEPALARLKAEVPGFDYRTADFASPAGQQSVLSYLGEAPVDQVICMAGGGPFGLFHEQEWKNHQWAWDLSFIFPARVAHVLCVQARPPQLIFVGSAVAESAADPKAASYCAAKHALKGLFLSLRAESPDWDVRLFSPGYMDTAMLPANAALRHKGVYAPAQVAQDLWRWSVASDEAGHTLYPVHPV